MFKSFLKLKKKSKDIQIESTINPHKHWIIILWIFLFMLVSLVVFSLYLLLQIRNGQVFQAHVTKDNNTILLKESLLKNVTNLFNEKNKKEQDLISNPPVYSDPSL